MKFTHILLSFYILAMFSACEKPAFESELKAVDTTHSRARLKTVYGDIVFKFFESEAPRTSQRVKHLITQGFYNGLNFHRVITDYIIQTGKPADSQQILGSGKRLKFEGNNLKHKPGSIAMARHASDLNSADSQFYISLGEHTDLDGKYTIFAQVESGLEVAMKIKENDKIIFITLE